MSDDNELALAAESYVRDQLRKYSWPASQAQYRLLLEIAFMEGSQWYNQRVTDRLEQRLQEVRSEAANA